MAAAETLFAQGAERVALVTGAASGIGAATVGRLVQAGIGGLVLVDRDAAGLERLASALPLPAGRLLLRAHDVADDAAWDATEALIARAVRPLGPGGRQRRGRGRRHYRGPHLRGLAPHPVHQPRRRLPDPPCQPAAHPAPASAAAPSSWSPRRRPSKPRSARRPTARRRRASCNWRASPPRKGPPPHSREQHSRPAA